MASHKRRHSRKHSRRHTRKRGGACPCASAMPQFGGRGGMGGADLGHAYTTGASQELYQMTGRTPGLSSGGAKKRTLANRQAGKAAKLAAQAVRASKEAEMLNNKANALENRAERLENAAANAAANARATTGLMRVNAPAYVPPRNLLNRLETNRGMRNQEKYLTKLMRTQNEENANNFNNLMREVHQSR
jgi:hypothetical protein